MQLEFGAGDDDRAARIIDALAEQILAEATLLALEHVRQRFQRTLVGARDRATAAAVVEQRSEEHTSELQSLMRISYAVFCLKKKNIIKRTDIEQNHMTIQ